MAPSRALLLCLVSAAIHTARTTYPDSRDTSAAAEMLLVPVVGALSSHTDTCASYPRNGTFWDHTKCSSGPGTNACCATVWSPTSAEECCACPSSATHAHAHANAHAHADAHAPRVTVKQVTYAVQCPIVYLPQNTPVHTIYASFFACFPHTNGSLGSTKQLLMLLRTCNCATGSNCKSSDFGFKCVAWEWWGAGAACYVCSREVLLYRGRMPGHTTGCLGGVCGEAPATAGTPTATPAYGTGMRAAGPLAPITESVVFVPNMTSNTGDTYPCIRLPSIVYDKYASDLLAVSAQSWSYFQNSLLTV